MKHLTHIYIQRFGLVIFLICSTLLANASEGSSCEEPANIEVNNETNTSTFDMAGQDYYFSFTASDSIVSFSVDAGGGDWPDYLELFLENCESEPIQISDLIIDSNNVNELNLVSYNLTINSNYILRIVQNSNASVSIIDLSYNSYFPTQVATQSCNMVVNGSFESYLTLGATPNSRIRIFDSYAWTGARAHFHDYNADYYHRNAQNADDRVPVNAIDTRTPKNLGNGNDAYAGLFTVYKGLNNSGYQFREWMFGTLKNKLVQNRTYLVKYYVSLSSNSNFNFDCVAPGLKFVSNVNQNLTPFDFNYNMSADIQDLTYQVSNGNWVEISGTYTANGSEEYFIIANFLSDNQSLPSTSGSYKSYFFIDEVSVTELGVCCSDDPTLYGGDVDDLKSLLTSSNYTTQTHYSYFTNQNETYTEVNGLTLNINGDFTVDQNLIFRNCKIYMGEDARILVSKELLLTGNQDRFIKSCNPDVFWDGVYVLGDLGGIFHMTNYLNDVSMKSQFENSMNGIQGDGRVRGVIQHVTFDRNNIVFENYGNQYNNIQQDLLIRYCKFTCSSPLINSLGNPYYPQYAIRISSFTKSSPTADYRALIGSCEFQGKAGQVYIQNSDVKLLSNLFHGFNNIYSLPGTNVNETAVHIEGVTSNQSLHRTVIDNNTFNSNLLSVSTTKSTVVNIGGTIGNAGYNYVNYDHNLNQPIAGIAGSKFLQATNNYYVSNVTPGDLLTVSGVQIYNVEVGIDLTNTLGTLIGGNYIDLESQTTSSYTSKSNVYGKGISLNNLGITTSYLNPTNTFVGNTVKHAKIGILAKFAQVEITENTIEDMNDITAAPSSCFPYSPPCPANPAYGIVVNNCEATVVRNKVKNYINQYSTQPKTNTNVSGIELINSILYTAGGSQNSDGINCNNVENTGIGIKFSASNSMFGEIYNNKMADNYYGFVLANNGSLDNVGNNGTAGHNEFVPNTFAGSATYSSFSNGALTTIYTEGGGGAFDPTITILDATSGYNKLDKDNTGNTVQNAGCNTRARVGNPNTTATQNLNKSGGNSFSSLVPNLGRKPYMVHAADSALMYQNQMTFYRLSKDSALMASKQWKHFADSMKLTPMGKSTGVTSRNSVSTNASNFDANLMLINPIVERFEQGVQLSATDLDHLRLMSLECPYYDGIAVYHARYVLEALGEKTFVNPCELVERPVKRFNQNGNKSGNENELNQREIAEQFKIYPNPTKGVVNIDFSVYDNEMVSVEIIDLMGKVQIVKSLRTSSFHTIELNELNTGIYFYRLVKNDATIHSGKLIIE